MPMEHIYPSISDWPIFKLSEKRTEFVEAINRHCFLKYQSLQNEDLKRILERVTYQERNRTKSETWEVDPPNEAVFWNRLSARLNEETKGKSASEERVILDEILRAIINRYSVEIVGSFKIKTFLFARRFLAVFFNIILNPFKGKYIGRLWTSKEHVAEKMRVFGPLDRIRKLAKDHVLILTPTHSSNLDSLLIGYMLDIKTGLPGFSYGAGLNLFNSSVAAYFMNRLGAYRVDRRKKNHVYLEALKSMSQLSIIDGTNSLFFPGGTRSRSNHLESQIKLGLLGTAIQAQRTLAEQKDERKVIVVPLVLCNHFVLEAKPMIEQFLKNEGKERYMRRNDTPSGIFNMMRYLLSFFKVDTEAVFSFGEPMDVFGHSIGTNGESLDGKGNKIDVEDYFKIDDSVTLDNQRESEYTKILGGHINRSFAKYSVILHSQMVAYAAFKYLANTIPHSDVYDILKLNPKSVSFNESVLVEIIAQLKSLLIQKEQEGVLKLDDKLRQMSAEMILEDGMNHLGIYHIKKPLKRNRKKQLISGDLKLLYFYHNRLDSYELGGELYWKKALSFQPSVNREEIVI